MLANDLWKWSKLIILIKIKSMNRINCYNTRSSVSERERERERVEDAKALQMGIYIINNKRVRLGMRFLRV